MLLILLVSKLNFYSWKLSDLHPAVFLITLLIAINAIEYRTKINYFYSDKWPKWKDEVKLWRQNNDYPLRIWPQSDHAKWEMRLRNPQNKDIQ